MKYTLVNSHRERADVVVTIRSRGGYAEIFNGSMPPFSQTHTELILSPGARLVVKSKPRGVVTIHSSDDIEDARMHG